MSDLVLIQGDRRTEVLRGTLTLPRLGVWRADLELGEGTVTPGPATLANGDVAFVGTILRGGAFLERGRAVVWGGAGGLAREVPAQFHRGPLLHPRAVASDILAAVGEQLSAASAAAVLDGDVPAWVRRRAPASDELFRLADALGLVWRVQPDGAVWLGTETWAAVPAFDHDLLDDDPGALVQTLGLDALQPALLPGRTFGDRKIAAVTYAFSTQALRATVVGWRGEGHGDESESLRGLIRQTIDVAPDDGALYPALVVAQDADGTLQCTPQYTLPIERRTLPGLTGVPLRTFAPGVTIRVAAQAVVLIGFADGRPDRPFAALWESGTLTELRVMAQTRITHDAPEVKIGAGATKKLGLDGDAVDRSTAMTAWMGAVEAYINGLVPGTLTPVAGAIGALAASATKGRGE